jgi:hypothetical protein
LLLLALFAVAASAQSGQKLNEQAGPEGLATTENGYEAVETIEFCLQHLSEETCNPAGTVPPPFQTFFE